jgi:hypothetical protein
MLTFQVTDYKGLPRYDIPCSFYLFSYLFPFLAIYGTDLRCVVLADKSERKREKKKFFCLPELQKLDLSDISIDDEGAQAIAASLKCLSHLRTLDLSYSTIGDQGAHAIAASLLELSELQTLDLSYNTIGDQGAQAIAGSLKHVSQLQILSLAANRMGCEPVA